MTTSLPRTSTLAVVCGLAVGTTGLALFEPAVLVGVLAGLFLGIGIAGFGGSFRRIVLASTLLPAGVLVAVATVEVDLLATLAVALGVGSVAVTTETLSETAIDRARSGALTATVLTVIITGFFGLVALAGGMETLLTEFGTLLAGGGKGGFLSIAIAALVVAVAIVAIPPAAFTSPERRVESVGVRNSVAVVPLVLGAIVYGVVQLGRNFRPEMVHSGVVRRVTAVITLAGLAVVAFLGFVRWSWSGTETDENAVVGVTIGATAGLALVAGSLTTVGVPGGTQVPLVGFLAATSAGLFVLWLFLTRLYGHATSRIGGSSTAIATVLVACSLLVGVRAGDSVSVTSRAGIAVFLALAAGLFTYHVGSYGWMLGREVGAAGATPLPQLIRTAWSGTVATFGVTVGICGFWVTALLAPALTTAATLAVVGGLIAVVVGTLSLLR